MRYSATLAQLVTAGLLMAFAGLVAAQQAYPNKPIRVILPFPPAGDMPTVVLRLVGQKLTDAWGQQVIVDNRPGANGVIGAEALAKSSPDGYTLMLVSSSFVINPLVLAKLPYDTIKDFAPVATVVSTGYVLAINTSVPANNLQEFIAFAKARPRQLNYGSSGPIQQLVTELFNVLTGVEMEHVPYKGGGAIITDLIGGRVQAYFGTPTGVIPHIKSGKLKGMAVSGETHLSALPQVPTFIEAGLPGYDAKNWLAMLAPAGTPKGIVDKISSEIARMLAMSDFKEQLLSQGVDPFIANPAQFAALIKADMNKYEKIIKVANIKFEN